MPRYQALPVEIDIEDWTGNIHDLPQQWLDSGRLTLNGAGNLIVGTREGPAEAIVGVHDIARGTEGEYYPIRRTVKDTKYEQVAE